MYIWLIKSSLVQNLAPQHIFVAQTINSDGRPSEYAFQFEFAAIIKHLLSLTYANLYRVLPEAKEHDADGNRRRRLDLLVRNHDQLPPYDFELLVQGDEAKTNIWKSQTTIARYTNAVPSMW